MCGCTISDIPKEIIRSLKSAGFEKGADYFFGKVDDISVRLYLNKDEKGRFRQITIYIPIKGKSVHPNHPFQMTKREDWTDIWAVFDPQGLGINLYTGKNIQGVISTLVKGAFKSS